MADVTTTAFTVIFIGVLLLIGSLVFGHMAQPMGDQRYVNETVITNASCTIDLASTCGGAVDHYPIENVTRAVPVPLNCTSVLGVTEVCDAIDDGDWIYNINNGTIAIVDDKWNGTIKVTYWFDRGIGDSADLAQQSITSTVYGGFDLASVMVIVMAAVAVVGTIFLIGRRGA